LQRSYNQTRLEVVHGLNSHNFKNLNLQKRWFSSLILFCILLFLSSNYTKANNLIIGVPTKPSNSTLQFIVQWDNSWLFKIKGLGQAVKTQNTPLGGVLSFTRAHYICLGEKDCIILLVKRPCY
jgi:hypothetical protein